MQAGGWRLCPQGCTVADTRLSAYIHISNNAPAANVPGRGRARFFYWPGLGALRGLYAPQAHPPLVCVVRTPFACTHANEDVKIRLGATWYGFPHDLRGRDDYAYVGLVAPQGFSSGSHVICPDGLESHTAGGLKRTAGSASGRAVFPVFLHNSGLNSFLCD